LSYGNANTTRTEVKAEQGALAATRPRGRVVHA